MPLMEINGKSRTYFISLDPRCWYIDFAQTSVRRHKSVYRRHGMLTHAPSRYTDGTVYQRQPPEVGIQTLFSNAYWHRNARVIEIQTRPAEKIIFFHETRRIFINKF